MSTIFSLKKKVFLRSCSEVPQKPDSPLLTAFSYLSVSNLSSFVILTALKGRQFWVVSAVHKAGFCILPRSYENGWSRQHSLCAEWTINFLQAFSILCTLSEIAGMHSLLTVWKLYKMTLPSCRCWETLCYVEWTSEGSTDLFSIF